MSTKKIKVDISFEINLEDLEFLVTIKKSYLEVLYPQCISHIWLTSKFFVLVRVFINLKKFYIDSGFLKT